MDLYRRRGGGALRVQIVVVSVVLSVLMTGLTMAMLGFVTDLDTSFVIVGLGLSVVIPAVVAPLVSFMIVTMLGQLDDANRELYRLATIDPLTGVTNRRGLFENTEPSGAASVGIVDVDQMKQLNDTHGHATGDAALKAVANALATVVPPGSGTVGRIGGDEFAVVSSSLGPEGLRTSVLSACSDLRLTDSLRVNVSVGVALHRPDEPIDAALKRADDALYQEKDQHSATREHQRTPQRAPSQTSPL